jgi:uroporphyrinogen-III synthase
MLRAENAPVEELPVYKAEISDEPAITRLKTLLKGGALDEFVFSSAEDLLSLRLLVSNADLPALLSETRVSAVSEMVFQTLQENDFRPLYFQPNKKG